MRELLAAAQADRKAKLDAGRVDTVFQDCYLVLPLTKELLDAADIGKLRPRWDCLHGARLPEPQRLHTLAAASHVLQPYRRRRPPQALL